MRPERGLGLMKQPERIKGRAALSTVFKLALAVGLLYWLISSGAIRFEYLTVSAGSFPGMTCAALLAFAAMQIGAVRYSLLLSGAGTPVGAPAALRINAVMYFFTQCLIGPASGDVARYYYTVKETGKGAGAGAAILMDRLIGTAGLLLLSAVGIGLDWNLVRESDVLRSILIPLAGLFSFLWLSLLLGFVSLTSGRVKAVILALIFLGAGMGFYVSGAAETLKKGILPVFAGSCLLALIIALLLPELKPGAGLAERIRGNRVGEKVIALLAAVVLYADRWRCVFLTVLVTTVQHLLLISSLFFFSGSINIPVPPDFSEVFFAAPLSYLAGIIPAPAAGLGVNETAFETFLKLGTSGAVIAGASIYLMQRFWITLFSLSGLAVLIFKTKTLPDG